MRRISLLLALTSLLLAASAGAAAAQATTVERLRGKDERGRYDVAWVRLADGVGEPAARARVNAELEREAREHICYPEADPERHKYLESWFDMEVTYLGPRVLGIRTRMDSWCGGASPSSGPGSLLFDLRTGRRIELESEMADSSGFRRFVAERAVAAAPEDAGECADNYTLQELTATSYIYVLNDHGLTATPDYPRVIMACGYDTKIPYAEIVRLVKPGSPLRTLGKR